MGTVPLSAAVFISLVSNFLLIRKMRRALSVDWLQVYGGSAGPPRARNEGIIRCVQRPTLRSVNEQKDSVHAFEQTGILPLIGRLRRFAEHGLIHLH